MMTADRNAPVVAASEIEIDAVPEVVWGVLIDFERWPEWSPGVKSMDLRGGVAEGSEFRWKAGSFTITSRLRRVDPPRLVAWTGKMPGIGAVHVWHLEQMNGHTIVRTEESWDGLLPRLLRGPMEGMLRKSLDDGLHALKAEVEGMQPRWEARSA